MYLLQIYLFFYIIFHNYAVCIGKSEKIEKEGLPFFRRTVEETSKDDEDSETKMDDPQSQLVSYLIKNVKEIFRNVYEDQTPQVKETDAVEESTTILRPTKTTQTYEKTELLKLSNDPSVIEDTEIHVERHKPHISHQNDTRKNLKNDSAMVEDQIKSVRDDRKRLCLYCNNVNFADCVYPKDKLMPSIFCESEGDLCYTQHTPFGIIDRGCFNLKKNISTYVCSCNLCNHLSISEMPHIFNEQDHWIADIIEMSNTIAFRRSIFKHMSCLKCEVNTTVQVDMLNDANCLEGNIGSVPTEDCNQGEVCAIQSIPSIGYIKRGCIEKPLYNYWLTLCDSDLCNYEALATVY